MKSARLLRTAFFGLMLGTAAISAAQAADPPLKVGLLEDVSGDLAFMGMPKLHGSQLAVEEINKAVSRRHPARPSGPSSIARRRRISTPTSMKAVSATPA
jgi:hypothetical protein